MPDPALIRDMGAPSPTGDTEPPLLGETIRREMKARGWRWPDIDRHQGPGGLSGGTLRQIASGRRRASLTMLQRIATMFDLDPTDWPEYRLALGRHMLDERDPPDGVGWEQALRNLSRLEEGLRAGPPRRAAKRAAPPKRNPPPTPPDPAEEN